MRVAKVSQEEKKASFFSEAANIAKLKRNNLEWFCNL
jgi:hypothetical protein